MRKYLMAAAMLLATVPFARAEDGGLTYQQQVAGNYDQLQNARYAEYLAQRDNPATRTNTYYACEVIATLYQPVELQRVQPCTGIMPGETGD